MTDPSQDHMDDVNLVQEIPTQKDAPDGSPLSPLEDDAAPETISHIDLGEKTADMGPLASSGNIDLLGSPCADDTANVGSTLLGASSAAFVEESLGEKPMESPPMIAEEHAGKATILAGSPRAPLVKAMSLGSAAELAEGSGPVRLWVKDPTKIETTNALGLKTSYYTFLIRTDSTLDGMIAEGMEVQRRFSEFDVFHKLLHSQHKGCFIPPLPEKSRRMEGRLGVGSSSHDDFMRLRRADLQAFLRAIVAHPVLIQSEALKLFLLQMGELGRNPAWLNMVEPPPSAKLSPGPCERRKEHITQTCRSSEMAESERKLTGIEDTLLGGSSEAAAGAPAPSKVVMGSLMSWVKASITSVTAPPPKKETPADELFLVQICSAKQQGMWRTNCVKTAAALVPLRDFHLMVPEAIKALEHREKALSKLDALEGELVNAKQQLDLSQAASSKEKTLSKLSALEEELVNVKQQLDLFQPATSKAAAGQLEAAASSSEKRSFALTQSIASLEEQIAVAKETYELVKQRNQSELTRFGLDREASFRQMLAQFASTQAAMVQASADAWASLASDYQQAPEAASSSS
eukprot:gene2904-4962_t